MASGSAIPISVEQTQAWALRELREGRLQQAEQFCRQILAQEPRHPEALHILGNIAYRVGQLEAAIDYLRQAVAAAPGVGVYRTNFAEVLRVAGRWQEAKVEVQAAIRLMPANDSAWCTLAKILVQNEKPAEAVEAAQRSISLAPGGGGAAGAYAILGTALTRLDRLSEAIEAYHRSLALNEGECSTHGNLAAALARMGRLDEAIAELRRAIALDPAPHRLHSELIYTLLHHADYGPEKVFQEHLEWARRYAEPLRDQWVTPANGRDPDRPLKVGYISPNFRTQAVSYFVEPILEHHDHGQFKVICYHDSPYGDQVTARLRAAADEWREVVGLSDEQLAERVREDQIDILVDLNGHLPKNRLLVFARKPSPLQVTYIGYQTTTGMRAMDYRITDAVADPPAETDAFHTEKLVRLPLFFVYKPLDPSPVPRGLPFDRTGRLTLGSMNNFVKIGPPVIALWSKILQELPESRLLVLIPGAAKGNDHVPKAFAGHGIAASRIELVPHRPVAEYLDLFNGIDIALDAFPFSGHTTTCDALWMGVPVVTLAGRTYAGRMAASTLTSVGLAEWIANSEEEYVQKVRLLAGDVPRLREWHATLRSRFGQSPAMDGREFTRQLEAAYRRMWREWCALAVLSD